MNKAWIPILDYEDLYSVSDGGHVKSISSRPHSIPGRILTKKTLPNGYQHVDLCRDGRKRRFLVHRLVAMAFLGIPPSEDSEVNHKDGDKLNNVPGNLEWVSRSQNVRHGFATGLIQVQPRRGTLNGRARLTLEQVAEIRGLRGKVKVRDLAERFGVAQQTISAVNSAQNWK